MIEDRFCGTCARYQNGVACKMVAPEKDPGKNTFGCKNWTDKPEDIESNPVARGPIITDCLPGSPSVCINCARYNPADGYCKLRSVRILKAESTTCMNWLQQDTLLEPHNKQKAEENPDILLEICKAQHAKMDSQKTVSSTAPDPQNADNGKTERVIFNRGRTIEQLDTVFDIACHMYPECADRWRATQVAIKDTLKAYRALKEQKETGK